MATSGRNSAITTNCPAKIRPEWKWLVKWGSNQGLFQQPVKHEEAFRQEVYLLILLVPLGIWLGNDGVERALLVAPLLIVLIVELINSAIESVVDRISDEKHQLSGRAKDQGSAAVLISLLLVVLCWGSVLASRLST